MNIYFACSITGGRQDEIVYQKIVDALTSDGHHVPTALLAGSDVLFMEGIVDPIEVYQRDITWIDACDALVAEVSTPSHGVGYEIAYALSSGKPVLCLYRDGVKVSKMLLGNLEPLITVQPYESINNVADIVRDYIVSKFT